MIDNNVCWKLDLDIGKATHLVHSWLWVEVHQEMDNYLQDNTAYLSEWLFLNANWAICQLHHG